MGRLELKQHKSSIGEKAAAKRTLAALGLRRIGHQVTHEDSVSLRGMIRRVAHLVRVEEVKS